MTFDKNLKRLRQAQNLSQRELAKRLGVANTSYFAWEQGKTRPKQENMEKLARILKVTPEVLLKDESSELLAMFKQLSDSRKENVMRYTKDQFTTQIQDKQVQDIQEQASEDKVVKLYPYKVYEKLSAGTGFSYMDDGSYDTVYFDAEMDYDFASWVYGDSMEPVYADGSVALIKDTTFDYDGAIYAIDWEGQTYIKKVYKESEGLRLVSLNEKYQDKFAPFDESPRIVGKIIGNFYPVEV
ncbi:MAG: XRE family transcriptional regulator [Lactococcus plantarum]|nr:XRE family transcriptional regulator [Lactococcus plantarum]MDN6085314.1 XRE family transcriptional regulator [Lactococcus plantarum]